MATRKKKEVNEIKEENIEKKIVDDQELKKKPVRKKVLKATVINPKVNIRRTPSLMGEIIGIVSKGDKLELISDKMDSGFFNIKYEGNVAYIMADFVIVE